MRRWSLFHSFKAELDPMMVKEMKLKEEHSDSFRTKTLIACVMHVKAWEKAQGAKTLEQD